MILLASGRMRARLRPCRSILSVTSSLLTTWNDMQTAAERAVVTMAIGKKKRPPRINRRQKFRTGIGSVLPTVIYGVLCLSLVSV